MSVAGGKDVDVSSISMLKDFADRVDAALRDLEESAGNPKKVGAQTIKASSLSSGRADLFPEAQSLYSQYNSVHEQLTTLSKTLHLHIEAISIGVRGAADGYQNLEDDQRRRFQEIRWELRSMQRDKSGQHSNKDESGIGA
ncbi:DUF2563 family protein [Streptomyces sp. MN13]